MFVHRKVEYIDSRPKATAVRAVNRLAIMLEKRTPSPNILVGGDCRMGGEKEQVRSLVRRWSGRQSGLPYEQEATRVRSGAAFLEVGVGLLPFPFLALSRLSVGLPPPPATTHHQLHHLPFSSLAAALSTHSRHSPFSLLISHHVDDTIPSTSPATPSTTLKYHITSASHCRIWDAPTAPAPLTPVPIFRNPHIVHISPRHGVEAD